MYSIVGNKFNDNYETFIDAFKYQQKHHSDKVIIYKNDDGIVEIVWKPEWEKINCSEL